MGLEVPHCGAEVTEVCLMSSPPPPGHLSLRREASMKGVAARDCSGVRVGSVLVLGAHGGRMGAHMNEDCGAAREM